VCQVWKTRFKTLLDVARGEAPDVEPEEVEVGRGLSVAADNGTRMTWCRIQKRWIHSGAGQQRLGTIWGRLSRRSVLFKMLTITGVGGPGVLMKLYRARQADDRISIYDSFADCNL
jgi:hypothetical protein